MTVPVAAQQGNTVMVSENSESWLRRYGLTKQWQQREKSPKILSKAGEQRKKIRGVQNEPKLVVDTVRFVGGSALVTLNRFPSGRRESVSATSLDNLRVLSVQGKALPISIDSMITSRTNDSVTIYSADTGTAHVTVMVQ
jgi:hypothetical protein